MFLNIEKVVCIKLFLIGVIYGENENLFICIISIFKGNSIVIKNV